MADDKQDPNKNDLLYETELVKVEFDKGCWGPNRWVVFHRPHAGAGWRLVAECPSSEEALGIAKEPERLVESAELSLTEVERRIVIQQLKDAEAMRANPPKKVKL